MHNARSNYLDRHRPGGFRSSRNDELSAITRSLKLLARELGVPIVLVSQLNRRVEDRPDKRPLLADLRDSGAIEQDADLVLMCYREEYYDPASRLKGAAEILIRKNRMGSLGTVPIVFEGQYSRFRDAERKSVEACRNNGLLEPSAQTRRGLE